MTELFEFLIHLSTAVGSLVMVLISYELMLYISDEFGSMFKFIILGTIPVVIFHFFESLEFLNIKILPSTNTIAYELMEHLSTLFMVVMFIVALFQIKGRKK
ncbi:MAG TPA: hypothetical protein VI894_02535 [Candidatus Nanoarchaeia archaeon]|nr:hypothetical protein [Candidatus Nanoarchaeia archaeon]